jgi:hypothetical protein
MKRASLLDLVLLSTGLVAAGCADDPSDAPDFALESADAGGMNTAAPTASTTTPINPSQTVTGSNTAAPTLSTTATASVPTLPTATATNPAASTNAGGAGGAPVLPTGAGGSGGAGGTAEIPDCEVVVGFDEAWGVVATGGGTNPMEWETSVLPSVANGVFSAQVPFTSSAQQFGWNGDYPSAPVNCTGRELVARIRLTSGFVADPQTAPGGVQMYLFSNEWANSASAWNNVPAPSEDWFEATVGCAAVTDSAFDPALVNGIGFTFNSGGADATAYTATSAAFEVDQLCWRTTGEPMGTGGAGGMGGQGNGGTGATTGDGGTVPPSDAGTSTELSEAGTEPTADAGESTTSDGGASTTDTSSATSDDAGNGSSTESDAGSVPADCEMLVEFNSTWGVVATGGGTDPEAWEASVDPTVAGGVYNVTVPFTSAVQQYGWVGDHPGGSVDCTGWELVARVRLKSGFVENPQTMAGGVQLYLFSDSWGAGLNAWNAVPAPSNEWFDVSVSCETAQNSDFDPTDLNGVGFTFNSGGEAPADYDADPAEFEVDYLCWRK